MPIIGRLFLNFSLISISKDLDIIESIKYLISDYFKIILSKWNNKKFIEEDKGLNKNYLKMFIELNEK